MVYAEGSRSTVFCERVKTGRAVEVDIFCSGVVFIVLLGIFIYVCDFVNLIMQYCIPQLFRR